MADHRLFVGTYTPPGGKGEGIYVFNILKKSDGSISLNHSDTIRDISNPSYLSITKNKKYLYAVVETASSNESFIQGYEIDTDQSPRFIDAWHIGDVGGCHVTIDDKDSFVFVANYHGGSIAAFQIDLATGRLERRNFYKFTEHTSVIADRQEKPHLHSSVIGPDTKFVYFADLGNDCIWRFDFSNTTGFDVETKKKFVAPPGSGPRHIVIDPVNQKYLYATAELTNYVLTYEIESNGDLKQIQYTPTTLPNTKLPRPDGAADIRVSSDSRFVYTSTRFVDLISVFQIQSNGTLNLVEQVNCGGKIPRNFILYSPDNSSHFVLVGNQESHDVTAFRRNTVHGTLTQLDKWEVKSPVVLHICD